MKTIDIRLADSSDMSFLLDIFSSTAFVENGIRRVSEDALKKSVSDGFFFDFNSGNGFVVLFDKTTSHRMGAVKVSTSLRNQYVTISGGVTEEYYGTPHSRNFLRDVMMFLFLNYPIERVEMNILATNVRSVKFHHKMGFVQEGIKRRAWFNDGALQDQVVMGMLKTEFMKLYGATPLEKALSLAC